MSSYSSMTEIMGDVVAARIVERFSVIVREATARQGGRVVDRVGDAFLLTFPEPGAAVNCALEIEQPTTAEPQFPAVRGAVHWGDLLSQEGGYVGGALNIASCVATHAAPHQILVTDVARLEIGELSGVAFARLGPQRLKGLAEQTEVFEARAIDAARDARLRDPVCGVEMAPTEIGVQLTVKGQARAFCCERCARVFLDTPERPRHAGGDTA